MSLEAVAEEIKHLNAKIILIYAFNTTGKTRLSIAYKNANKDAVTGEHLGVYYNAFSEDLFSWDNDIENDEANVRLMVKESSLNKLHASFTEEDVMRKLEQFKPKYNFFFEYKNNDPELGLEFISFHLPDNEGQRIKISRGEERIFVWCLFLTMFEIEGWADEQDAHFFIDDPVSSLDDHYIFVTASSLFELIEKHYENRKIILTTHHIGLYSILADWLTKGDKSERYKRHTSLQILNRRNENITLEPSRNNVFLYHLHLLQVLDISYRNEELLTYHFALLRQVLENVSSFLGRGHIGFVLQQIGIDDTNEVARILNVLAHEQVYRYKTERMTPDNEELFKNIFEKLKDKYNFALHTEHVQ